MNFFPDPQLGLISSVVPNLQLLIDVMDLKLTDIRQDISYVLFIVLCLPSFFYYAYGIYAAFNFLHLVRSSEADVQDQTSEQPAISIIKPICGLDIGTYENFASFCQQDYPHYQIIFGVHDSQDPCIEVVNQIIHDFPDIDIQLVINNRLIGTNYKVSNLSNILPLAKHPILVIADSDVRVGSNYLKRTTRPLKDPKVGMVTCLFRPIASGWISNLEAVGISTDYLAGVLVANCLQGMTFAIGPTVVIRRETLDAIGGFEAISNYLADDFQIGNLTFKAGYKVVLSDYIIDQLITTNNISDLLNRQIRWHLCTRVSRPWGYLGLLFTYGVITSFLTLIITSGAKIAIIGLIMNWLARIIMGWTVGVIILKDQAAKHSLWLLPLRDCVSFGLWCYGFFWDSIKWRGRRMIVLRNGKLVPILI